MRQAVLKAGIGKPATPPHMLLKGQPIHRSGDNRSESPKLRLVYAEGIVCINVLIKVFLANSSSMARIIGGGK